MLNVLRQYGLGGDIALVILALASWLIPPYYVFTLTSAILTALLCLSIGLTAERAGIISLCQLAFAGIGAWVAMWLCVHIPACPIVVDMLAAGAGTAAVALLVSLPTLRVRGINLAIITLALALAVNVVLTHTDFPGMMEGLSFERPGWLSSDRAFLVFCIVVAVIISRALVWLEQRPFGAAWFAARYSERAAAALGTNVSHSKISAFTLGGFIAGIAGALLTMQLGSVTAHNFEPYGSLVLFALAVLARSRFLTGALVAGLLTWFTPQVLTWMGLGEWKDIGDLLFAVGAIHALSRQDRGRPVASAQPGPLIVAATAPVTDGELTRSSAGTLEVHNLTLRYGAVVALSNVSFKLSPGKVTGLVGPNGAGKSSLVDVVSGFVRSQEGSICLDGVALDALRPHDRASTGLRRTFQQGRAVPELTVRQYVRLASGGRLVEAELDAILQMLACPDDGIFIGSVDVGTRRLIEIAGALSARPHVLLLDEPAAGMSTLESDNLARVIQRLPRLFGCTVLLIEHDLNLIRNVCSELLVLEFGKIIAAGPVEETLAQPHVIEAYVGAST
ncbi:amino acid/amide ABC transporter membrane protein 2 (HAAT family) /amino acid/amide ABC transporter ATP-binding protein 1 (HAAT family) [Paraburkholderia silvatlantica]|uniref:Amino acid/amide ABC transporter membrane protein 2 (HAAT family) /amino acid/amide ABC transporter ATP-binding protein 1 (HAAT family) n=1 Tax=Paraburkholderia silvatlantica TaxID=321895 RepID=A0A2V4TZT7_9BURK|nr:ATP-binding cassette domain-containing protein [Paraburkholderia silvatlantica]PYE21480.1 amino acid/amide ABC transporter membrane protein 2 (HAAT family) /amino acid/amide ABC transporter ATP-binding protein 1 (HAAT family) [Paraburkholderia silvatlantica]